MGLLENVHKIDRVAPLIADPPPANSITMRSWVVCHDRNLCLGQPVYFPYVA